MRLPFRRPSRPAATPRHARRLALGLALVLGATAPGYATETETETGHETEHRLVLVEQPGCHYCIRWHEQIGPAYPKTAIGAFAPLRTEQLRAPPDDLDYARRVTFTPTFILVDASGTELARLEGYPGEDFFWPMLEQLVADAMGFVPETKGEN